MLLRYCSSSDQVVSTFFAWKNKLWRNHLSSDSIKMTVVKYLPPINAKVIDFNKIDRYLMSIQKLADEANMSYINLTLDDGAAINDYKVI